MINPTPHPDVTKWMKRHNIHWTGYSWEGKTKEGHPLGYGDGSDGPFIEALGLCGCGCPEAALAFIRDALALVQSCHEAYVEGGWEANQEKIRAMFHGDSGIEYFTYYWLADKKLTQHGGSVPGWLTDEGRAMLAALRALPFTTEDTTP